MNLVSMGSGGIVKGLGEVGGRRHILGIMAEIESIPIMIKK